jgi:hypothetical protein
MNTALYDPEQERIKSSILMAQALRKQGLEPESEGKMLAGFGNQAPVYVSNTHNNQLPFLRSALGQFQEGQAMDKMQALMNQRNAEEDAFLAARPSETMAQTTPIQGPTQPGEAMLGDVTVQVPKPYQTLAQETRDWTSKAPRYSPLGGALKQRGMEQAINAPEKMFEAEEAGKRRAEEAAIRANQTLILAEEKADTLRAEKEKDRALRMTLAQMSKGTQNANADLQRQIMEQRLEDMKAKSAAGTAAQQKAGLSQKEKERTLNEALYNIDLMLGIDPDTQQPVKGGGILKKATASGIGSLVDTAAGWFGSAPEGAVEAAKLAPLADPILKMVPRFEGPQSDKDTAVYKAAAGNLADSTKPKAVRIEAAKTIKEIMLRRKGQFDTKDSVTQGASQPAGPEEWVRDANGKLVKK